MKFKLTYVYVAYELVSFVHEMYKRKASSIRFELQEEVGKVNLYIDDVSFKQLDGKIAWKLVKGMFSYIAEKTKSKKDFDKDVDVETTFNSEDLKNFKLDFLPLPKGKCLRYSYITKPSGIYEVCFSLVSNDVDSLVEERVNEVISLSKDSELTFEKENENEIYSFEAITFKKDRIRIFLEDKNEKSEIVEYNLDYFENKNHVKSFFQNFKLKNEVKVVGENVDNDIVITKSKNIHW